MQKTLPYRLGVAPHLTTISSPWFVLLQGTKTVKIQGLLQMRYVHYFWKWLPFSFLMSKTVASHTRNNAAYCFAILGRIPRCFYLLLFMCQSWHSCNIKTFLNRYPRPERMWLTIMCHNVMNFSTILAHLGNHLHFTASQTPSTLFHLFFQDVPHRVHHRQHIWMYCMWIK